MNKNTISLNNGKIPFDWNIDINSVKESLKEFGCIERKLNGFTELFIKDSNILLGNKIINGMLIMHFYGDKLQEWSLTIFPQNKKISLELYNNYKEKYKCISESTNSYNTKIFRGENDIEKINIECDSYMLGIDFYSMRNICD